MAGDPDRLASDTLKLEDVGVTPIAGVNGGQSTFVGGDDIGIWRDSKIADAGLELPLLARGR